MNSETILYPLISFFKPANNCGIVNKYNFCVETESQYAHIFLQ